MKNSKKTWLWEIIPPMLEGEDTPPIGSSYLFGTIHIRDQRAFTFLEAALNYLSICNVVVTEFDLDEAEQFSSGSSLDLPADFKLRDALSEKHMARLDKLFQWQIGMPLGHFENMHPFVLTSLLTESIMSRDMPLSLDQTIWQAGKGQGKKMAGLESYDFQMNLIQTFPIKEQVKMLKSIIRNFKSFRKKQLHLVDLYAQAELSEIYQQAKRQSGAFRKPLLHHRNISMAESIAAMAETDTHFFAVGGGHLPGKNGLIRLLKKKGFKVKPVKLNSQKS